MIFRVHGKRGDGSEATVDIECDSEAVARNEAVRHGLVNTSSVEVVEPADEDDVTAPQAFMPRPIPRRHRGAHIGVARAFEIGFGFGLGLAAASAVVFVALAFLRLLFGPLFD